MGVAASSTTNTVENTINTYASESCTTVDTSLQEIYGTLKIENCDNFNYTAFNTKKLVADCSLSQNVESMVKTLQTADSVTEAGMLSIAVSDTANVARTTINNTLDETCENVDNAKQVIQNSIECKNSKGVTIESINNLSAQTACTLAQAVANTIDTEQIADSETKGFNPIADIAKILILVVIVIVVLLVAFGIFKGIANTRAKSAGLSISAAPAALAPAKK